MNGNATATAAPPPAPTQTTTNAPSATPAPTSTESPTAPTTSVSSPTSTSAVDSTSTPTPVSTATATGLPCDVTNPCFGGRFCELPSGVCGTALDHGVCVDVAPLCSDVYTPVCGCDGLTYGNDCLRRGAMVQTSHEGACATVECQDDCDCYTDRTFALPCPLDCANCGNCWTCQENRCFEHCGFIPPDECAITVETGKTLVVNLRACLRCICASPDTPIATPDGEMPIAALAVGDLVYSIHQGQIVLVPIQATNRVPVHAHHVVRLALSTGAVLEISPNHPTADGRTIGDLHAGDRLAGVEILAAELVPYAHDHTYDILPASDSGVYFAAGIPLGSTLSPGAPVNHGAPEP